MDKSESMAFKMMNQDVWKFDKFDGTNFNRWREKMWFLLTILNVAYVLDPSLQPLPEATENDTEKMIADRKKREEDELICRGHILNALADRLFDLYSLIKTPTEIWNALEHKYTVEKIATTRLNSKHMNLLCMVKKSSWEIIIQPRFWGKEMLNCNLLQGRN
ncbi:hypothetical protein ACHQM5_014784 [Ranunculus cassubicifolius]